MDDDRHDCDWCGEPAATPSGFCSRACRLAAAFKAIADLITEARPIDEVPACQS